MVESAHLTQKLSRETPPVIMITLNRFYYDRVTQSRKKKNDPIDLSYSITITKEFLESEAEVKEVKVYVPYQFSSSVISFLFVI